MVLPNFLVGGVSAGGSSYMAEALKQHPDIYMAPLRPEPHYFYKSWEFAKPLAYYESTYFSKVASQKAIGEMSSSYLFGGKLVAERIRSCLPDVKIVFSLRNPIERTFANYRYTVLSGLEELDFDQALRREPERVKAQAGVWAEIQPHNYTGRGFYGRQLSEFLHVFPREQLLVLKSEQVGKEPQAAFQKVFRFLGVSDDFQPVVPPRFSSLGVKDAALQKRLRDYFGDRFSKLVESVRGTDLPQGLLQVTEDLRQYEAFRNNIKEGKDEMSATCRALLADAFRSDVQLLKPLVDFPLDDWK